MHFFLSPFAPEKLVYETGSAVLSHHSMLILHTQAEAGAYSRPPPFRDGVLLYLSTPLTAIGSVPSLLGHARRRKASSPESS